MSFIVTVQRTTSPLYAPVDMTTPLITAPAGVAQTWTITNFDTLTTYTVTTTNGVVTQSAGVVTYTPSTAGVGGFTINNRAVPVTVTPTVLVDYFVVSGGGGGGDTGGGGGGGGIKTGSGFVVIPNTAITVTVGAGGAGNGSTNGSIGGASSFQP